MIATTAARATTPPATPPAIAPVLELGSSPLRLAGDVVANVLLREDSPGSGVSSTASSPRDFVHQVMAKPRWQPDMIVGIDFGMTCTGVAWSMGPEWPEPKTIQHWPGRLAHELRNKVDTAVAYELHSGDLKLWGFLCDPSDQRYVLNELFKLHLDPNYKDTTGNAPTLQEATRWFHDYLSCLYKYITRHFRESLPRFEQRKVEYIFSVPTTWKDLSMLHATEKIIARAGFGQRNNERASIYLTEAEAAAVYISKQSMEVGDVFLICDIGGGTTDLNVLKVKSAGIGDLELTPLSWTEGMAVGSTLIDFQVQQIVTERLQRLQPPLSDDPEVIAESMVQDNFMAFKCSLGNDHFGLTDLYMPVPGLQANRESADAHIRHGKMLFKVEELQTIFDEQITKLFGLIDLQLQIVQSKHPQEMIPYLILSGGLGSSPYVQNKVRSRYQSGAATRFKNAKGMSILVASEPQLAVVHGLVMARTQACKAGKDIISQRCSAASYGIVCREPYDPAKHQGQDVVQDETDKKQWAVNQIAWIVKRGELFDIASGAAQKYQMRLSLGEEKVPWKVRVAMSTIEPHDLPRSVDEKGAKVVCEVEFELSPRDFAVKNKHWYQLKRPYLTGDFEVRVIVGAGLRFEIWSKDRMLSREHEEVKVEWLSPGSVPQHSAAKDSRMYRVADSR